MHHIVGDAVICRLFGVQLLAEDNRRHAILFKTTGRCQLRLTTVHRVQAWCRSIASVIIPNAAEFTARRSDDDVGAVHGIKIVLWRVVLRSWLGCKMFNRKLFDGGVKALQHTLLLQALNENVFVAFIKF